MRKSKVGWGWRVRQVTEKAVQRVSKCRAPQVGGGREPDVLGLLRTSPCPAMFQEATRGHVTGDLGSSGSQMEA